MSGTMLQAAIAVNSAPDRVLRAFQQIESWPMWYPGVMHANWIAGEPWLPTAMMEIHVKNSLGMRVKSRAVVLPTSDDKLVWENRGSGLVTVCHAWVEPVNGGSRFTLQKFYSGATVPLLRLLKGRQERMLQEGLENLRAQIETK